MAEMITPEMNALEKKCVSQVIGQKCVRCHIGDDRSFFLGFGEIVTLKSRLVEAQHATWEIGTYYDSWRIVKSGEIICGRQDAVDSVQELRQTVSRVSWGNCCAIRQLTRFDVRIEFGNDLAVDILATTSEDDEVLHIFCPEKMVVTFSLAHGWVAGRSDTAWKNPATVC